MTEERQFLLEAEDRNKSKSGLTAYEIASQELRAWKTNYGALKSDDKLVPVKKQITFTWSEINAYGLTPTPNPKSNAFTSLFRVQEKTQKHILKNVNGIAYPGELLVLMGSSGAGKTTLMNCMTFRNLKSLTISGSIRINDQPVTQTQLAAQSAYVQQDDLFIPYLTVKEHLIFQALVRMDSHFTYVQRMQRVEEVLTELSLKKCENVKIGEPGIVKGISGGERKRLALAAELLTNPSLLFCDEPTSGLDSFMSLNVMQLLKSMAQTGRTVICTLHQPSSEIFLLFDKIGLMAEGRTAFLGSLDEADKFFTKLGAPCPEDYNPADHYIQILSIIPGKEDFCKESLKCICDAFESSTVGVKIKKYVSANKTSVSEESWTNRRGMISPYKVSWCAQFWAVLWRCWLALKRNPSLTNIKFFQVFFTAILFCIIFGKQVYDQEGIMNIDGILYLLLLNTTFLNITNVITVFCGELPLF
ncbi:hypothetical protein HHI36_021033 [Cryptolaemus montrouzieri]|uniref:Protein white n=1 Tax=Cryptolaemus montrouzieri TaxID=559131 RepID=A0ABD2MWK1_9CUCU